MDCEFISVSGQPTSKVSLAAVANDPEIVHALHSLGIKTLSFEDNNLQNEVSRHTDMLLCHPGGNTVFVAPSQDVSALQKEGFSVLFSDTLQKAYPDDVKLNCAVSDKFFVCNEKSIDKKLYSFLIKTNRSLILTLQGYTKCSLCFIRENAAITDDISVFNALTRHGIDTLLISKGDIFLSDKHYGFFGGCTGKTDRDTLGITGELKYHKDCEKITFFCKKHEVKILELKKGKLTDIGGIIPLKQYK